MFRYCPEKFKDKCGSCINLNLNKKTGVKYECIKKWGLHGLTEDSCGTYEFDENRDYDDLEYVDRMDDHYVNINTNCYLTTIICEILGFEDDCDILTVMRVFRNNILQKDLRYLNILVEYDMVGPEIASNLKKDENALWIAKELLEHYIKPIIVYINNRNYDAAVVLYKNMTNLLKENYALVDCEDVEDYDQSMGGHGRVYKKVNC